MVVADFPALPAQGEDDGGLGVVLLAESEKDLRVALVQAVVQIAPELLGEQVGEQVGARRIRTRVCYCEQLHEAVRSLHVPVRALLGRRHSDWLDWLWGWSCLRRFSLRRLLALGSRWPRCRHTFRGFGLVLASGRAASSLRGRLGHSSRRRRRRRLWGRLHRRWSRLRGGLRWRWLRGLRRLRLGHGVSIFLHFPLKRF